MQSCTHCSLPLPAGRTQFCCFGCHIAHQLVRPALKEQGSAQPVSLWMVRLGLGVFLAINIMVFNWIFYSGEIFGEAARSGDGFEMLAGLFAYLQLFFCTVVVAALGLPLLADSSRRWWRRPDANFLISVAVFSAYGLSAWNTIRGSGSLYFDTAAMVLVLLTLGNYLEARSKRRAATSASALDTLPQRAWVERGESLQEADTQDLQPGDLVRVRVGEVAAVDGIVRRGRSHLDASRLTGESLKRSVSVGDQVLAGSVNLDGELWIEAQNTGPKRTIARMQQLLEEARSRPPSIQRVTDRVAAIFAPVVIVLALGIFGWRAAAGRWEEGLLAGLSLLLISCPCALGLAAPLSCWSGLRRAADRGILFDSAQALERASKVRRVFFDKTGTLTEPELEVVRLQVAEGISEEQALYWAATAESSSLHPIAGCLVARAGAAGIAPGRASDSAVLPGIGIQARIEGTLYRLGGGPILDAAGISESGRLAMPAARLGESDGETTVYLVDEECVLARFDLLESLRTDAPDAVKALASMGVESAVLTGDEAGPAQRQAARLGLPVEHSMLPQDKVRYLRSARKSVGATVAMVGDGINDAPVLAAADVGISVISASGLAHQSGNVRLLSPSLLKIPESLTIARHTVRRIRLGLAWAFGYNSIGITLAALGLLTPVFAASSMVLSSLLIITMGRGAGKTREETAGSRLEAAVSRPRDSGLTPTAYSLQPKA